MKKLFEKVWWIVLGVAVAIFVLIGRYRMDPDFGWHYKWGELVVKNRAIPATDQFSYTMASFAEIRHEWLQNILMYWGYEKIGMWGLSVIYAVIVVATIVMATPKKLRKWSSLGILLAIPVLMNRGGVRTQVVDWIFWVTLIRVIWDEQTWKKWKWGVVPLIGLWANLHGGFVVGLAVLLYAITCFQLMVFRTKKIILWGDWIVFLTAILATFVNPYGINAWREVEMTLISGKLLKHIAEWQPFWVGVEFAFWIMFALCGSLIFRFKKLWPIWKLGLIIIVWIAALSSLRHMALFAILGIGVISEGLSMLAQEVKSIKYGLVRLDKFYAILLVLATVIMMVEVWVGNKSMFGDGGGFYPVGAVEWLKQNKIEGRMFADYGYGGYLIWFAPEYKTFVDGRMAIWQRKSAPEGESKNAFEDYLKIVHEGEIEKLNLYDVKIVMWTKERIMANWTDKIVNWLGIKKKDKDKKTFLTRIKEEGWKEVYADDTTVIFVKNP